MKDQFWTRGILTTNGSRVYRDFVPDADATVITRLQQAGTILLGKLNRVNSPWEARRSPMGHPRNPGIATHTRVELQVLVWHSPRTSVLPQWERTPGVPAYQRPTAV